MKRIACALALIAMFASDLSACHRCGLFGRRCRFSHHVVHQQVAYVPPVTSQNFIFNNLWPAPYLLAPQGNSVYGVQQASAAYAENPAFYMDRAARFTDRAFDLAQTGQQMFKENSALAIQASNDMDRRATNAQIAALAMEANRGTVQQTFSVQIQDGKMSIVQPQQVQAQQPSGPQQLAQANSCGSCHNGSGANGVPRAVVLDGSVNISQQLLERSNLRIMEGTMPPNSKLTPPQKAFVMASLASLLQRAPVLDQGPPPPPEPESPLPPAGNLR